jgi:hypothetical protein
MGASSSPVVYVVVNVMHAKDEFEKKLRTWLLAMSSLSAVDFMGLERKRSMMTIAHAPGAFVRMKLGGRISRRVQPTRTNSRTGSTQSALV